MDQSDSASLQHERYSGFLSISLKLLIYAQYVGIGRSTEDAFFFQFDSENLKECLKIFEILKSVTK